jgi:uncharacterized protein
VSIDFKFTNPDHPPGSQREDHRSDKKDAKPVTTVNDKNLGFDDWLGLLRKKLPSLGYARILAFAASCCERSVPNYKAFSRETHWGDPKVVAEALELIWRLVPTKNPAEFRSYARGLQEVLKTITPDTEQDFKSLLTSAALDAANSVAETLDYPWDESIDHVVWVSSFARDTIDLFVQYRNKSDFSDKNVEAPPTAQHALMVAELHKQQADMGTLESIMDLTPHFLASFRSNATNRGKSNLGIG